MRTSEEIMLQAIGDLNASKLKYKTRGVLCLFNNDLYSLDATSTDGKLFYSHYTTGGDQTYTI